MSELDVREFFETVVDSPPGEGPDLERVLAAGRRRRRRRHLTGPALALILVAAAVAVLLPDGLRGHRLVDPPTSAVYVSLTPAELHAKIERVLDTAARKVSPASTIEPMTVQPLPQSTLLQYRVLFRDTEGTGSLAVLFGPSDGQKLGCSLMAPFDLVCSMRSLPGGWQQQELTEWPGLSRQGSFFRRGTVQRPDGMFVQASSDNADWSSGVAKQPGTGTPARVHAVATTSELAEVARQVAAFAPRP